MPTCFGDSKSFVAIQNNWKSFHRGRGGETTPHVKRGELKKNITKESDHYK